MRANQEFFKLLDPIGQSLLFILFAYSFDSGFSYHTALILLAAWQVISWVINSFIKLPKLLKNERLLYMFTLVIYLLLYFFITKRVRENFLGIRNVQGVDKYPVHEIILVTIGLIIAFWYYVICFREVKSTFKKK